MLKAIKGRWHRGIDTIGIFPLQARLSCLPTTELRKVKLGVRLVGGASSPSQIDITTRSTSRRQPHATTTWVLMGIAGFLSVPHQCGMAR